MTDNPSEWAMAVWRKVFNAADVDWPHASCDENAAALVIEQARKEWESEVVDWLRSEADWQRENRDFTQEAALSLAADRVERGEYRKDRG